MKHDSLYRPAELYRPCFLCPRRCGALRESAAYCGETADLRIACANIHRGEEPPLTGITGDDPGGGSGTIFISGCNLRCVFCQNYQISLGLTSMSNPKTEFSEKTPHCYSPVIHDRHYHAPLGRIVDTGEFARICLALQDRGAENINIVTGTHAVPAIIQGINAAKAAGLAIPVLWNSSAYEVPETLELLLDTVDVFLPDLKTLDRTISQRYYNAPDYPDIAVAAIKKMLAMKQLFFMEQRLVSGLLVRHLVLPGYLENSRTVLRWFADNCAGKALLSLMFQFTPVYSGTCEVQGGIFQHPQRYITRKEYETVMDWLVEFDINDGYCQELVPGNSDWLPDFNKANPFPSDLSVPIWHWKNGFL